MTYPPYLREKARQLRRERQLTIDELADRLALSRSTIYYWVKDLPISGSRAGGSRPGRARRKGNRAMQAKYRRLREEAYELGRWEFPRLAREPLFRDFVCLYIAEGYKRSRHTVKIANSDPAAIALAVGWMPRFSTKRLRFSIQHHADQDLDTLTAFWARAVALPDISIRFQRKSNSGQLAGRTWRCEHGVISVSIHDTCFRSRLQGWIDRMRGHWLDSLRVGA
jgi:excisionase family DNA binding protein